MKRLIRRPLTPKGAHLILSQYSEEAVELGQEFIDEINATQIRDIDDDSEIDDQRYVESRMSFYRMVALDEGYIDNAYEFKDIVNALYALNQ